MRRGLVSEDELLALREALSESDLTIEVDIVDLRTVDPAFRNAIAGGMIRLPLRDPPI